MSYLDLEGVRLFYERQGKKNPPLVFVHGFACSHADWQLQVEFFRTQQCVVTCDLRGHGNSDGDPAHCSIETFGADVKSLLSALALPSAVLIGHSLGCRVVLQTYLDAPQQVAGLVLVDGSCLATGDPQAAEQTARQRLETTGYATMMQHLFADMFVPGSDPALKAFIFNRALALPEEVGATLFPRLVGWDARSMDTALSHVTVPLLILQSTYVNPEHMRISLQPEDTTPWFELVRHHVPTAQIEVILDVGHFTMLEAADATNQAIAAFAAALPQT